MNEKCNWPGKTNEPIKFYPIGIVVSQFDESSRWDQVKDKTSRIIIDQSLEPGLEGLRPGDQLSILFYFHQIQDFILTQHPKGDMNRPKRGVFTICSPKRPNPIGLTVVELVSMDKNVLEVRGLDAFDGTPVIDIKPV